MSSVPVDRGWGWVIVLGTFLNLFVALGIAKSLGILFVELLNHYKSSAASTAVLFSLLGGIGLFSAPVTTALAEILGFRLVCMTGAVLSSLGLLIGSFGHSLGAMIYPFGVITGLGFGMLLNPAAVIIAKYFDKKRAFANGLMFAGTGFGGMLFPYIMHAIVREYTIQQSLLVLSAISLNTLVGASLFRPISFYSSHSKKQQLQTAFEPKLLDKKHIRDELTSSESLDFSECYTVTSEESVYFSARNLATVSIQDLPAELEEPGMPFPEEQWTFRKILGRLSSMKNPQGETIPLVDFQLFRRPEFCLLCMGCFLSMAGFYIGMVTPAHCENLQITKSQVAVLLSVMGASDTAGRLLVGIVSDFSWIKLRRAHFITCYLLTCSVSCGSSIFFAQTFFGQLVFLVIYPVCFGAFTALIPVLLSDIVGTDRLSGGWGIVLFIDGVAHVVSPLLIGAIRDSTGSFVLVYVIISFLLVLASCCYASIILYKRLRTK